MRTTLSLRLRTNKAARGCIVAAEVPTVCQLASQAGRGRRNNVVLLQCFTKAFMCADSQSAHVTSPGRKPMFHRRAALTAAPREANVKAGDARQAFARKEVFRPESQNGLVVTVSMANRSFAQGQESRRATSSGKTAPAGAISLCYFFFAGRCQCGMLTCRVREMVS